MRCGHGWRSWIDCPRCNDVEALQAALFKAREALEQIVAKRGARLFNPLSKRYGDGSCTAFNQCASIAERGLAPDLGCQLPPSGWWCSREPGHDGPCAARPIETEEA